jgi:tRNA (cytidine/uridine-2'-O-)-methyltransferase
MADRVTIRRRSVFSVVLFQPEIPPNTGNVIRLCANTGAALHLIAPLGFELDDARLRRAGLDYREYARLQVHADLDACLATLSGARVYACSTRAARPYHEARFRPGDAFLLGPETRGLPPEVLAGVPERRRLRIPMYPGSRSLNLSNAAAVLLYEAWRQTGFAGGC